MKRKKKTAKINRSSKFFVVTIDITMNLLYTSFVNDELTTILTYIWRV